MTVAPAERQRLEELFARVHQVFLAILLAIRPLVWDGDRGSPANLIYLFLVLFAGIMLALEGYAGLRRDWRWGRAGWGFLLILVVLMPGAWRALSPLEGWGIWGQLAIHGILAFYLCQVIPGRRALAGAALMAGLAVEAALALLQQVWVLPAMARSQQEGDLSIAMEGLPAGELTQRIAQGGIFGTFTLSNTLAAFLLLTLPVALGAAWKGTRDGTRLVALLVAVVAVAALLGTASKGAWLAGLAVGALAWWWYIPNRWRWLPVGLGAVGVLALILHPTVGASLQESARVRLGYWQGAWTLFQAAPWTGHGLGSFAILGPAVMPLWAETSRLVHNELLEAAVIGGLPLAILLAVTGVALVRPQGEPGPEDVVDREIPLVAWILGFSGIIGYLALLGGFDGNFGWWPGGGGLVNAVWGLVVGAVLGAILGLARTGFVPGPFLWTGILAFGLHSLIDFNLHSFGCVGVLIAVAVLRSTPLARPAGRWPAGVLGLAVVGAGIGLVLWGFQASAVREAEDTRRLLGLVRDATHRQEALNGLASLYGQPPANSPQEQGQLMALAWTRAWEAGALDPQVALGLLGLRPSGAERSALLLAMPEGCRQMLPWAAQRAQDLAVQRAWADALTEMRRAVGLSPSFLPLRQDLVSLLERAAAESTDVTLAGRWRQEALAERAELERLQPIVYPRNRQR